MNSELLKEEMAGKSREEIILISEREFDSDPETGRKTGIRKADLVNADLKRAGYMVLSEREAAGLRTLSQ